MNRDRFELAVFDPARDGEVVSCRDYLRGRETGSFDWLPDPQDSALVLVSGGVDWLSNNWNLGDLSLIVRQLEELERRIGRGELAILRSAVLDQPVVPYFVFESSGPEDLVLVSQTFFLDPVLGRLFPLEDESREGYARLSRFWGDHRVSLIASDPYPERGRPPLKEVPFPRAELLRALPEEIDLGRRVLALA